MNLDFETLQNILKINGFSLDTPPDQIKTLLAKANYSSADVDAALAALHGAVPTPPAYPNSSIPMAPTAVQYSDEKPPKSSFWIWTTLWLTAVFDAFLILVVYVIVIGFLEHSVPDALSPSKVSIVSVVVEVLAICVGSYAAARYVLKRASILKSEAGKYAGLSIIVPAIGSIAILGLGAYLLKGNISLAKLLANLGQEIISLGLMYFIIRSQLEKKGE
jgi:hypothetical protein